MTDFELRELAQKETSPVRRLAVYLYPAYAPYRVDYDAVREMDRAYLSHDTDHLYVYRISNNNLIQRIAYELAADIMNQKEPEYEKPWWAGFANAYSTGIGGDRQAAIEEMLNESR